MTSIFSQIIEGTIPSYKVYENDFVIAFLDVNPIQPGHILIVPKIEIDQFVDLPDDYYFAVFQAAKIIAKAQIKAFGVKRIGTKIEGFAVPHFHYHLIPVNTPEEYYGSAIKQTPEQMQKAQESIMSHLSE